MEHYFIIRVNSRPNDGDTRNKCGSCPLAAANEGFCRCPKDIDESFGDDIWDAESVDIIADFPSFRID